MCSHTKRRQASDIEKSEAEDVKTKDESHDDKRSRMEETTSSGTSDSEPVATATSQKALPPPRCNQCRQLLDDPDLSLFPGDPCDAVSCEWHQLYCRLECNLF